MGPSCLWVYPGLMELSVDQSSHVVVATFVADARRGFATAAASPVFFSLMAAAILGLYVAVVGRQHVLEPADAMEVRVGRALLALAFLTGIGSALVGLAYQDQLCVALV